MKTLLLNKTYEPLMAISWQRAFALLVTGKAQLVVAYDAFVSSAYETFPIPSVIRLVSRVRVWRRHAKFSRRGVFQRDNNTCQYCEEELPLRELTLDHVHPKSRGGRKTWGNIVSCCQPCNLVKSDRTPEEAGMALANKPTKPLWGRNAYTPKQWEEFLWE